MLEPGWLSKGWRIIAAAVLVAASLGLAGCSALRLAYNQADTLLYWRLDSYFEFTPTQTPRVRQAIDRWFEWNRRREVPGYAALLDTAADEVLADTTPARVCKWFDDISARLDRAVEQALPDAAVFAASADAAQLDHLEQRQAEVADEWRDEFLQPEPAERRAAAVKRARERAEQLYGRLDANQRERLERGVAASPFDAERWLVERQRRQRDLAQALRELQRGATPREDGAQRLRAVWQRVNRSPDAAYRRYLDELVPYNCALSAEVHNSTTPAQRQAAQRQLRAWQADLVELVAQPG